ncbi:argininosuccinate synthase [Actinoplanes sp. NBRC 14428]|nr:argininosuccinate synthase [Actinoplanes sp. NBRC 14428]
MKLAELRHRRVGVLMSGGLSCTAVGVWLAEQGVDVVPFVADLGQRVPFPPAELARVLGRSGPAARVVDLRAETAELAVNLARWQATHDGGYWNTTSGSRHTLVTGLAQPLRDAGCTVLVHGCVGGGNDEGRFHRYAAAHAPDLTVFSPWRHEWLREQFPGRREMAGYLLQRGLPAIFGDYVDYSVDGTLAGFSHDGGELEELDTPVSTVTPLMSTWPSAAREPGESVRIRFEAGRPVALDDVPLSFLAVLTRLNQLGGRNGVALRSVVENRVNGTKCRGVYEAPGLEILGAAVAGLYQVMLDKAAVDLLGTLSRRLGRAAYEGRLDDPAARAAILGADLLAEPATGEVKVDLYRGTIALARVRAGVTPPGVRRQTRFAAGGHHWSTEEPALV